MLLGRELIVGSGDPTARRSPSLNNKEAQNWHESSGAEVKVRRLLCQGSAAET